MPKDDVIVRQGTFNTAPADTISSNSIKRGDIEIPIVLSDTEKKHSLIKKTKRGPSTDSRLNVKRTSNDSSSTSRQFQSGPAAGRNKPTGHVVVSQSHSVNHPVSHPVNHPVNGARNKPSAGGEGGGEHEVEDEKPSISKSLSKRLTEHTNRDSSPSKRANETIKSNKVGKQGDEGLHEKRKQNRVADGKEGVKNSVSTVHRKRSLSSFEDAVGGSSVVRATPPLSTHKELSRSTEWTDLRQDSGNIASPQKHMPFGNKKTKYFAPDDMAGKAGGIPSPEVLSPSRYKDVNVPSPSDGDSFYGAMKVDHPASPRKKGSQTLPRGTGHGALSKSGSNQTLQDHADSDHSKLYELVRLERDGLLRAEVTYKQRIKQLEDESKAFLIDAKGISDKNIHLQIRIDELESNNSQQGDSKLENKHLLERCEKLERENQSVYMENQKLKSDNSDLEKKVVGTTADLEQLRDTFLAKESKFKHDMNDLHDSQQKLESDYETLTTEKNDLVKEVTELKNKNQQLNSTLGETHTTLNDLQKSVEQDKHLLDELQQSRVDIEHAHKREIERIQKHSSSVSKDLEFVEDRCKILETEKTKLGETVRGKDMEIFQMKDDVRKKKTTVSDLHSQIEHLRKEIERLKIENDELRLQWTDDSKLKGTMAVLEEELEKKSDLNKKMKRELTDKTRLIDDLTRELANANATAMAEAEGREEKLELDEKKSVKIEREMKLKSNYIAQLETELFETKMKVDSLKEKAREIEKGLENKNYDPSELKVGHKTLLDENRHLRLLLVESNIDVTNRNSEKTMLSSRLEKLEQKQMDSDLKVRQLQNWVDVEERVVDRIHANTEVRKPVMRHGKLKVKADSHSREEQRRLPHDLLSQSSSPSLPAIDCKIQPMGYFDIYKQKLKLLKVKKLV